MATTESLLTAEEFAQLPGDDGLAELVKGQIVMMNMPNTLHGVVCSNIVYELRLFLSQRDSGRIVSNDAGIITARGPDTVRGADVAYYSYERLPKGSVPRGYPTKPPELVFEVRFPSDRRGEIEAKTLEYLGCGVNVVCIVEPESESILIHRVNSSVTKLGIDDVLALPDVLPELTVSVRSLFRE